MAHSRVRPVLFFLLLLMSLPRSGRASGPLGVDSGWVIYDNGGPILTDPLCATMSAAGVGWVRMEFRLIPGHSSWDSAMFGFYDRVVNSARAVGLQVLGLIDNSAWPGTQAQWVENNYEHTGRNGSNSYIDNFALKACVPLIRHFHDRIKVWEIWNEPNAWTRSPGPGYFEGGTFLYPSNYSQMLANVYADVKKYNNIEDVTLLFGGVLGHSIGNIYSYQNSGAQYIDDTYNTGINRVGSFAYTKNRWGVYPLDGIGQHLYIDQSGVTTTARFRQYLDWVRQAYTRYEGGGTSKKTVITEFGWTTAGVSQSVQAQNLAAGCLAIRSANYVRTALWFRWQDNPGASLYHGLRDPSGNPKTAFGTFGYYATYEGMYSDGSVNADLQGYYYALGPSMLGSPYDNGGSAFVHTWSANGYGAEVQDYDGGANGRLALFSGPYGLFEVNNTHGFWDVYLAYGGIAFFGTPVDNEYPAGNGTQQDFEAHSLTWDPVNGIVLY